MLGSGVELRRDLLGAFERSRAHGDVVRFLAGPPGWRVHLHAVHSPEGARHVLVECMQRDMS